MKIVVCHNQYQHAGGEDIVVAKESAMLAKHGHEVSVHSVSNDSINSLLKKLRVGFNLSYSKHSRQRMAELLDQQQPDIVHFHNTFPLLTPSVYDACIERNIPVIQTLHNFRTTCAGALLLRDNQVCELCVHGTPWQGARYKCYRGSYLQSLAAARMIAHHRRQNTWNNKVSAFIALTEFSRQKFVEAGFEQSKIHVKPNFIDAPAMTGAVRKSDFALYAGRISNEKGLDTLVQSFNDTGIPIKIIGDGPDKPRLQKLAKQNIEWLGHLKYDDVLETMRKARFLVMPSQWYETFGMVIVEAFSQSLPVLCSGIGAMKELVNDGETGFHFPPGNVAELSSKSRMLYQDPDSCLRMGAEAKRVFQQRFTEDRNYETLIGIYRDALST